MSCNKNGKCYDMDKLGNFIRHVPCKYNCKLVPCSCCTNLCPTWYISGPEYYCQVCKSIGPKKRRFVRLGMACSFCHKKIKTKQINPNNDWEVKKMHRECWNMWKKINGIADDKESDSEYSDDDLEGCIVYTNPDVNVKIDMPKWTKNILALTKKVTENDDWHQEQMCVNCRKKKYVPIYSNGYRALCTNCFRDFKNKLKDIYECDD
ncbi:putative ORFan [Tupanvirus deep ocean]|uniref:ORFan n=2 Tax=Tupanvirus TaxID=2094720 RepID=A0AC62A6V8_9VIRU|nr:putative ORFan [Tupanvirus deep ocean]QKU33520.1 putative ORFan [Tupanvirus deep ocean]